MKTAQFVSLACMAVLLLSCGQVEVETPEGFAKSETSDRFRAISPEGVVLRIRSVRNEPRQNLSLPFENASAKTNRKSLTMRSC